MKYSIHEEDLNPLMLDGDAPEPKYSYQRFCYEYKSEREVSVVKKQEAFMVKGVLVETVSDVLVCQACGEEIFDEELDGRNLDRVYEKNRRMKSIRY